MCRYSETTFWTAESDSRASPVGNTAHAPGRHWAVLCPRWWIGAPSRPAGPRLVSGHRRQRVPVRLGESESRGEEMACSASSYDGAFSDGGSLASVRVAIVSW